MKIIAFLFLLFVGVLHSNAQYTDMKIYKSFIQGGTTARICHEFHDLTYSDTSHINIDGFDLNHLFDNAKCSKMFPQKHAGISCGGEVKKKGEIHYLFVCMPDVICDVTDGLKYTITDTADLHRMDLLFRTSRVPSEILDCLPEMGKDTLPVLNTCESIYLSSLFSDKKKYVNGMSTSDTFNFENKRIAFFHNNDGIVLISKKTFFDKEKYALNLTKRFSLGLDQLFVLSDDEAKHIGYDAIVISGSKKNNKKKDVIKILRKE